MIIYFLTKQKDVCSLLAEKLMQKGHECTVYLNPEQFYSNVKTTGSDDIDLLAIDYRSFEHDSFNPYKIMINENCVIPLIYYNDPFPEPEERAVFWKMQNHYRLKNYIPDEKLENVFPLLSTIQTLVNSSEINPYLTVINKPKELLYKESQTAFDCESFRKEQHIPSSRYALFVYFYENCNRTISAEELCLYLWNEYSNAKLKTLYSYIHDLRSYCKQEKSLSMKIERRTKETYALVISNEKNENANYSFS